MPALIPTGFSAEIIWLGPVRDRLSTLVSEPVDRLELRFAGPVGDSHGGLTRPSCSRVTSQHPRGTEIRNTRQLSIVSQEELARIAKGAGLDALDPGWLGATIVLRGIPALSHLPPSSRLQGPSGATVVIDMENRPCHLPAQVIRQWHPAAAGKFKDAARGRRGVMAWVEREGEIALGDTLMLHVPDQPTWPHLTEAQCGGHKTGEIDRSSRGWALRKTIST